MRERNADKVVILFKNIAKKVAKNSSKSSKSPHHHQIYNNACSNVRNLWGLARLSATNSGEQLFFSRMSF
jgi:hypothetical protein